MAEVLPAPVDAPLTARRSVGFVLQGGILTTAITLTGLAYLPHAVPGLNLMGRYWDYVIPYGAILVGLAAGSGYGIGSYLTGVRIRKKLLLSILLLQILAYLTAEYLTYLDAWNRYAATHHVTLNSKIYQPMRFVHWYDNTARSFAWRKKDADNTFGEPLGLAGYFFVLLAAAGFVGGGLIAPLICLSNPYCEGCQIYMKTRKLGMMPASILATGKNKKDPAYEQNQIAAGTAAQQYSRALIDSAAANDSAAFIAMAGQAFQPSKLVSKLPVRMQVDLIYCPVCSRGWIKQTGLRGQGKQISRKVLNKTEINADFAKAILDPALVRPKR